MKIMFMGTPEIAAICLEELISSGHEVSAVVTGEDKPRGRGYVMTPPPVKVTAEKYGIAVYQPKTLRDSTFSDILDEVKPQLIAVVAYGKILPKNVIEYPKYGCINVHVSLLPKYRGAAPMQRAIMNGEKETGVTIMYMDEGLDTGDIIMQRRFPIGEHDNFETVHDMSAKLGKEMLAEAINEIENGTAKRVKQGEEFTYAPKIERADCMIDFGESAAVIDAKIRGTSPIPLSFTKTPDGKILKIYSAHISDMHGECGRVLSLSQHGTGEIVVGCGDGAISLEVVVPEGKSKMNAADFIRGRKIKEGDILKCT